MPESLPLPRLLIIGAMKSGTTSLYMDIADRTSVFLSENKEPHALCHDSVLTPEGLAKYAAVYRRARPDEVLCDGSTGYTKLPLYPGVVDRALKVLPKGFRVVYLVRNPIERMLSHFRHEYVAGTVEDPEQAIRADETFLSFSRYAMQLRPWLDAIGPERIHVETFERYVANRSEVVAEIAEFAGLPVNRDLPAPEKAYNQSERRSRITGWWHTLRYAGVYRNLVRPLIPVKIRLKLIEAFAPKVKLPEVQLSDETLAWVRSELVTDAAELADMLGRAPLWPELVKDPVSSIEA